MWLLQIAAFVNPFLPYLRIAPLTFSYSSFSCTSLLFCASSVLCFLSCLHCLRAIGKHCLPLFFFTIDFCMFSVSLMFCLMPLLRSLFRWESFYLLSIVPSSSLFPPCVVAADSVAAATACPAPLFTTTVSFTHKVSGVLNFLHFVYVINFLFIIIFIF